MASSRPPSGTTNASVSKVGGVVRMLAERGLGSVPYRSSTTSVSFSPKDGLASGSVRASLPSSCAASDYKPAPRSRLTILGLSSADTPVASQALALRSVSDLPDYATAVHSEQSALPAQRVALLSRRFPSVRHSNTSRFCLTCGEGLFVNYMHQVAFCCIRTLVVRLPESDSGSLKSDRADFHSSKLLKNNSRILVLYFLK